MTCGIEMTAFRILEIFTLTMETAKMSKNPNLYRIDNWHVLICYSTFECSKWPPLRWKQQTF